MDRTSIISRAQSGLPLPELLPRPTTMTMPSVVHTANLSGLGAASDGLTADTLVQRLPSIVNSDPVVTGAAACGGFTQWVSDNPLLAAAGLAALAYFTMRHGK